MSGNRIGFVCVCLALLGLNSTGYAQPYHFAGGTGEPNDPYQIATAEQLVSIGSDPNLLNKHFVLLNDIDLDPNLPGGRIFTRAPIAPKPNPLPYPRNDIVVGAFTGDFDGHGHRIRNLIIQSNEPNYPALFGWIGRDGVVTNLGIDHAQVGGQQVWSCGALAAENEGRIVQCYAEAHVSNFGWIGVLVGYNLGEIIDCWGTGEAIGDQGVGGLVGMNAGGVILKSRAASKVQSMEGACQWFGGLAGVNDNGGLIQDCYATGPVSGRTGYGACFGGLVGENTGSGMIVNSYATGSVSIELGGYYLGGLVGRATGGSIYDCYATADISGSDSASDLGGLAGRMEGAWVTNSYSTGRVSASANSAGVGGLVGSSNVATISGCFWDTETSGVSNSASGTGLTTAEMQSVTTFIKANWDWVDEQANGTADPWFIPEGGDYPQLTAHSSSFQPHKLEGSGTPDDPYRIATAEDLGAINHYDLGACYRLEADISLAGTPWHKAPIQYFEGRLDGAGKVVTGLRIEGREHLGLFGVLGRKASVENLGMRDADVAGVGRLGVLAGTNKGHITACYANGSVTGSGNLGALTGWNEGSISDSYAIGRVTGSAGWQIAGLTGCSIGTVRRCYAGTHVTSSWSPWSGQVVGGLVGSNQPYGMPLGEIGDSYFLIQADGGGPDNSLGVALTGIQMRQQASFAGWDFDKVWTICEGKDYPRLRWEDADCGQ